MFSVDTVGFVFHSFQLGPWLFRSATMSRRAILFWSEQTWRTRLHSFLQQRVLWPSPAGK